MSKASIPNPALEPLSALIGTWTTTGSHPFLPGKILHGQTSFEWFEGGAFILMKSHMDEPKIPSGLAVFGSDDATGELFMLYFDERKVSRKYDVVAEAGVVSWSRETPEFSQRVRIEVTNQGRTLVSKGSMSQNGGPWEGDLDLTYEWKA